MIKGKPVNVIKSDNKIADFNTRDGELLTTLFKKCFIAFLKDSINKNQPIIFSDPVGDTMQEISVKQLKEIVKKLEGENNYDKV